MVERNGDNYLSLGEQPLAILFCVFSLIYLCLAIVWSFHLRFSNQSKSHIISSLEKSATGTATLMSLGVILRIPSTGLPNASPHVGNGNRQIDFSHVPLDCGLIVITEENAEQMVVLILVAQRRGVGTKTKSALNIQLMHTRMQSHKWFFCINYYVIGRHGVQEEGWAVMYYIAHIPELQQWKKYDAVNLLRHIDLIY
ncbi:hypothetical protein ACTXT7_012189 [Hymenolepis weldensis]